MYWKLVIRNLGAVAAGYFAFYLSFGALASYFSGSPGSPGDLVLRGLEDPAFGARLPAQTVLRWVQYMTLIGIPSGALIGALTTALTASRPRWWTILPISVPVSAFSLAIAGSAAVLGATLAVAAAAVGWLGAVGVREALGRSRFAQDRKEPASSQETT